jgi:predicted O-methyltransferase YrrM
MDPFVYEDLESGASRRGLDTHYPFLYNAVLGLEAKKVFEFGAGKSTFVLLAALQRTGGVLRSISTETVAQIVDAVWNGAPPLQPWAWVHTTGRTQDQTFLAGLGDVYDLVVHDGSHAARVVRKDLRRIMAHVNQYGLILIHDTQHSYVGGEMREAVREGLRDTAHTRVTLPYGFGLTIVRVEGNAHLGTVQIARQKQGSPHRTELGPV